MMTHSLRNTGMMAFFILLVATLMAPAATFTVTNINDTGPGSLRDALTQANVNGEADTINFDPGVFNVARTIVLTADLPITRDGVGSGSVPGRLLTINGPGPDLLTISGNNAVRAFYLSQYSNVVMSGMTLRDGIAVGSVASTNEDGGAIHAQSSDLSLSNMVIRNNSAISRGGGIHLSSPKTTIITDSILTENSATSKGGGMIVVLGQNSTTMRNVVVSNNSTENEDAGVSISRGNVTIENCLFTGNRAGTASGGSNRVGALTLYQSPATVTDTTFSNNSCGALPPPGATLGVNGEIGAIHAEGADMVFKRVTITGNKAHGDIGGIYMRSGGSSTITLIDSTVSNNESATAFGAGPASRGSAGGVYATGGPTINVINTTIANNVAGRGGGVANFSTGLNIFNCTIVGNTGTDSSAVDGGGGIYNHDTGAVVTVKNSIIAANTAPPGKGPNVKNAVTSAGYNIIGSPAESTGFGATGDQINVDPLLDPNGLQNNGGATLTIALQPNSPAIDKGHSSGQTTDQRGVTRPTDNPAIANAPGGDGADIGAFEIGANNGVAAKTLGNIATRLPVLTGENVLIGGIIVTGNVPKRVIVRGIGPSLGTLGVSGALADPVLELYQGNTLLMSNDNWQDSQGAEITATGVAPSNPLEAAIVQMLNPGNYTAVLRGKGDTTGVGLVDGYDLNQDPNSKLANISTRGFVGTGDNALIAGFIAGPNTRVVIRAIGPSLTNLGVNGALPDPTLQLVDAHGQVIRSNDNWKGIQRAELEAIGIQPSDDRESALIANLVAGNYTAVVRGTNNTTGVAVVEVYNLQ